MTLSHEVGYVLYIHTDIAVVRQAQNVHWQYVEVVLIERQSKPPVSQYTVHGGSISSTA